MAFYTVVHYDWTGREKARYYAGGSGYTASVIQLEYARKEREIGYLYLDLLPIFPVKNFVIDDRLEVWRQVGAYAATLEMETVWFIRLIRLKTNEQGEKFIHIVAHDAIDLLDRRIVAYNCHTAQSDMTGATTTIIYNLFDQNFGPNAIAGRNISSYLLNNVAQGWGVTQTKADMCRRKILPLFQELIDAHNIAYTPYLTYDVVKYNASQLSFVVYSGQRGQYRGITSKNRVLANVQNGVLSYASVTYDYLSEYNHIYAGGKGEDSNKVVAEVEDVDAVKISGFNRREDFIDTDVDNATAAYTEAVARLDETRSRVSLNGHISQVPGCIYGVHYNYGDVICVEHEGSTFDVHLDSIDIQVNNDGSEEIKIYSRNLSDSEY